MRVAILASGSAGNCTMFAAGNTRVLVDAGIGVRTLERKLRDLGLAKPTAIVITHAHRDHVGSYEALARRYAITVHFSEATHRAASPSTLTDTVRFGSREPFAIGALTFSPIPLPHDAAQVGFTVTDGTVTAGIATDLGEVPPSLPEHLAPCDLLLIESNHDVAMLENGHYPSFLKRRIRSARGHLSNVQTAKLLRALPPRARTVVLMHLSESNNAPALALDTARDVLAGRHVDLRAAVQDEAMLLDVKPGHTTARPARAQLAWSF